MQTNLDAKPYQGNNIFDHSDCISYIILEKFTTVMRKHKLWDRYQSDQTWHDIYL